MCLIREWHLLCALFLFYFSFVLQLAAQSGVGRGPIVLQERQRGDVFVVGEHEATAVAELTGSAIGGAKSTNNEGGE